MKPLDIICHACLSASMWFMSHISEFTSLVALAVLCLQGWLFIVKIRRAKRGMDDG